MNWLLKIYSQVVQKYITSIAATEFLDRPNQPEFDYIMGNPPF